VLGREAVLAKVGWVERSETHQTSNKSDMTRWVSLPHNASNGTSNELTGRTMIDVIGLKRLGSYRLEVEFSDGSRGIRDFADIVSHEGKMVRPLRDPNYFTRVFIEDGTLIWPNGYDVDSIALHCEMKGAGLLHLHDSSK
jgi:hypothetical protein